MIAYRWNGSDGHPTRIHICLDEGNPKSICNLSIPYDNEDAEVMRIPAPLSLKRVHSVCCACIRVASVAKLEIFKSPQSPAVGV